MTEKIDKKIQKCKDEIIANAKDAKWMKDQLALLTSLQKQADVEAVELIVPTKEIQDSCDFGAYSITRTIRGILFQAKGGMSTFVESRMLKTYSLLNNVFDVMDRLKEEGLSEEQHNYYDAYISAVSNVFQIPILASLDEGTMFETATFYLQTFYKNYSDGVDNAVLKEETEEDIEANNAMANMEEAKDIIAENAPAD